eukprot:2260233-Prymnesium_polylepis.1
MGSGAMAPHAILLTAYSYSNRSSNRGSHRSCAICRAAQPTHAKGASLDGASAARRLDNLAR